MPELRVLKLNNSDNFEPISAVINEALCPILFNARVKELNELGMSIEEARKSVENSTIELELYYENGYGLMAVDSEAVSGGADIFSPYTKEQYEEEDD
jgi:hypothetical protein